MIRWLKHLLLWLQMFPLGDDMHLWIRGHFGDGGPYPHGDYPDWECRICGATSPNED